MNGLEQFHFLRPWWLLAFVPLIWILLQMARSTLISRSWEAVVDRQLLPFILVGNTTARGTLPSILLGLCGTLAILALAGPVWEKLPQPVFSTRTALVVALDLSRSMDAADIQPTRLERARFKINDFLDKRAEGQTALLVYAGDAFAVTPLTDDVATIKSQLLALTTDIMPVQGSQTGIAITMAIELLKKGGAAKGDILLITDEVDFDRAEEAAGAVTQAGYRLSILGVGTEDGAPIAKPDGGFLTDELNNIIVPVLDEAPMQQLAGVGGGRYTRISLDDTDIETLDSFFSAALTEGDVDETEFETDVWREQGPWLLVLLIPLSAVLFRRGYIIVLVLAVLPWPQQAEALDWDSLWLRQDQRAKQALDAGDAATAAELFEDPSWKGAAQYRAGQYEQAVETLKESDQIENNYNQGNAHARKGQYDLAIKMYEKVLAANPQHEDARFNKELLEKELEQEQQQQKQDPNQQQDQQKDENQEKDEQNQQQNQQQNQDEQQQQQDQKQQDQNQNEQKEEQKQEEQQEPEQQQESESKQQEQGEKELPQNEEKQATEQWLRRIPDDPGGLLRRKFLYQYQQRDHGRDQGEKTW
jgi:Ca-activated chloride channel family protein